MASTESFADFPPRRKMMPCTSTASTSTSTASRDEPVHLLRQKPSTSCQAAKHKHGIISAHKHCCILQGVRVLVENRPVTSVSEDEYRNRLQRQPGRVWPLSVLHRSAHAATSAYCRLPLPPPAAAAAIGNHFFSPLPVCCSATAVPCRTAHCSLPAGQRGIPGHAIPPDGLSSSVPQARAVRLRQVRAPRHHQQALQGAGAPALHRRPVRARAGPLSAPLLAAPHAAPAWLPQYCSAACAVYARRLA